MKSFGVVIKVLVLTVSILVLSGCAAVEGGGLGARTVASIRGDLETPESASVDEGYRATVAAFRSLELELGDVAKDAFSAKVAGADSRGKRIDVRIIHLAERRIEIRIRVGTLGDKKLSHLILEEIRKHLKAGETS